MSVVRRPFRSGATSVPVCLLLTDASVRQVAMEIGRHPRLTVRPSKMRLMFFGAKNCRRRMTVTLAGSDAGQNVAVSIRRQHCDMKENSGVVQSQERRREIKGKTAKFQRGSDVFVLGCGVDVNVYVYRYSFTVRVAVRLQCSSCQLMTSYRRKSSVFQRNFRILNYTRCKITILSRAKNEIPRKEN